MHRLNPTAIANCYQDAHYDDGHRYDDAIWYEEHMKGWSQRQGMEQQRPGKRQNWPRARPGPMAATPLGKDPTIAVCDQRLLVPFKWASTMASTMHSTVITTTTDDPLSGTTGRSGLLTTSSSCYTQWIRTERWTVWILVAIHWNCCVAPVWKIMKLSPWYSLGPGSFGGTVWCFGHGIPNYLPSHLGTGIPYNTEIWGSGAQPLPAPWQTEHERCGSPHLSCSVCQGGRAAKCQAARVDPTLNWRVHESHEPFGQIAGHMDLPTWCAEKKCMIPGKDFQFDCRWSTNQQSSSPFQRNGTIPWPLAVLLVRIGQARMVQGLVALVHRVAHVFGSLALLGWHLFKISAMNLRYTQVCFQTFKSCFGLYFTRLCCSF